MIMLLSILDIISGLVLALNLQGTLVTIIGTIILLKGIYSLITSLIVKYPLDWMGWIDLITGIMILTTFSISWFWVVPILKGAYSFISS
ncbi:MAG: hypothetical protein KJ906_03320 [Nanoarchaeota archaeon]|nr:hypothetical protein [Nanoarchaeota archaeon]